MAWSPDYCLNCDKQTSEPHYCSQSCRLADLAKSAYPNAPVSNTSSASRSSSASSPYSSVAFSVTTSARSNMQVQLQPAFNFAAYRQPSSGSTSSSSSYSPPSSPRSHRSHSSRQYPTQTSMPAMQRAATDYSSSRHKSLNTSASRSSLSSLASTSTSGLSDQALLELQKYSNAFDHMRNYKRRVTLG